MMEWKTGLEKRKGRIPTILLSTRGGEPSYEKRVWKFIGKEPAVYGEAR